MKWSFLLSLFFQPSVIETFLIKILRQDETYTPRAMSVTFLATLFASLFLKPLINGEPTREVIDNLYPQINISKFKYSDLLRFIIQTLWIVATPFVRALPVAKKSPFDYLNRFFITVFHYPMQAITVLVKVLQDEPSLEKMAQQTKHPLRKKIVDTILVTLVIITSVICLTVPFEWTAQVTFISLLFILAMLVKRIDGRLPNMLLLLLSLITSTRYLWWRYSSTLNWDSDLDLTLGFVLLAAETYGWIVLVLGYFQNIWPLKRKPTPLTADATTWPEVDLFIPTFNEELEVLRPTVLAALGLDWPEDKLNIYVLDDGKRTAIRDFSKNIGVGYICRPTNEHAKAGNINYALKKTSGEFVAIFDRDHIPSRGFLQMTMGSFIEQKNLALIQTPHHFYSPDPFERNLGNFGKIPNEGNLFYGLVQDGNDLWDASFFCGSCAILRRDPLEEIGGIAIETVTEDAHTTVKMHRLGYSSAYLRVPVSAGLATETLSAHIGQRIRWARGMAQILRLDNPLIAKGLKWPQRLCYFNGMMHFLSGIPRIIFLIAPLAYLLLGAQIILAPPALLILYVVPHMIHSTIANSKIQGEYRHNFWGEVYETVISWYIAKPTLVALIAPHIGKFNVTAKGGLIEKEYLDWGISKPYVVLILLNLAGMGMGGYLLLFGPQDKMGTVIIQIVWTLYNLLILGAAMGVSAETKQIRVSHRTKVNINAMLRLTTGELYPASMKDFSIGGVGLSLETKVNCQLFDKRDTHRHR